MRRQKSSIPLNPLERLFDRGIFIGKVSAREGVKLDQATSGALDAARQSHRDDYHFFLIQDVGDITLEIDFQRYKVKGKAIVYIHPGQVHRIRSFKNFSTSFLAIDSVSIQPEYLELLHDIAPVKPLRLTKEDSFLFSEMVMLSIRLSERKGERLHHSFLKNSCNALIGLMISQYLRHAKSIDNLTRFEVITKTFKASLDKSFVTVKRPAEYAQQLNITTAYLNECVKNTTGHSVSYHIQQRIVLEAMRLLYHTDRSIKEVAAELGYHDYPYFSRLFTRVAGMSALTFRNKNRD